MTLYKEDVRKLSQPTNKVLAIMRKNYNEDFYTGYTYLSKGHDIQKLANSDELKMLIRVDDKLGERHED